MSLFTKTFIALDLENQLETRMLNIPQPEIQHLFSGIDHINSQES